MIGFFVSCSQEETMERVVFKNKPLTLNFPNYVLPAYYKKNIIKLNTARFKGQWIVLFFYPADFTFVCPTELKDLSDLQKEFDIVKAQVVAVSTDSEYVHRAWFTTTESLKGVKYPILADRAGKLSRAMGVFNEKTGTAYRASFIISPEGKVVAAEYHHDDIGRSAEELLRKLHAAIAVRNGGGGYCPANWKKGDKLIKGN